MLEFKPLTLSDKPWVDAILRRARREGCEYSFSCALMWSEPYGLTAAEVEDFFVVRAVLDGAHAYLFPAGDGALNRAIDALERQSAAERVPLRFYSLTPADRADLEALRPGAFDFVEQPDAREYLYTPQSLITLAGKKLHGKRNHIHRFVEAHPDWSFEELVPENLAECYAMNKAWCRLYGCDQEEGLRKEACAVQVAFDHYFELGLQGGLLRAGGKVLGFAMGEPLSPAVYNVRIEKAFHEVQGAYAILNRSFAERFCQEAEWINREEDTGDEGLRRAKMSYRPARFVEKFKAGPAGA